MEFLRYSESRGLSEQIRMRSGADEVQVVAVDLVDQWPIRLDVAIAEVLPVARERVVLVPCRQRAPIDQQQDRLAQLRHIRAALLYEFHIAPELRALCRVPHRIRFPGP